MDPKSNDDEFFPKVCPHPRDPQTGVWMCDCPSSDESYCEECSEYFDKDILPTDTDSCWNHVDDVEVLRKEIHRLEERKNCSECLDDLEAKLIEKLWRAWGL